MPAMLPFNKRKALEAASHLLNTAEEVATYEKLVLLLYLADRKALMTWGHPITTASYLVTEEGVELNNRIPIFELKDEESGLRLVQLDGEFIWEVALSGLEKEDIMEIVHLSDAEMLILDEISAKYGSLSFTVLLSILQELPEIHKKGPIYYRDILKAGGKLTKNIVAAEEEMEYLAYADALLEHLADRHDIYVAEESLKEPMAACLTEMKEESQS